jgi:hypothetical protein
MPSRAILCHLAIDEVVQFLNGYVDRYATDEKDELKYVGLLQRICNREEKLLRVDLEDLIDSNPDLVARGELT